MSEYTHLEILICICASDIVKNSGAHEDMLYTLYEALLTHFEKKDRTIH